MRLRALSCVVLACSLALPVCAEEEDEYTPKVWKERAVSFPVLPQPESLMSFFVSAASANQFFVDGRSISVGEDGVVRYTLVVETAGGARNVTYEGMRCETREMRIYATDKRDGGWSPVRTERWSRIRDVNVNRHHAALFLEYFCPGGVIVRDAAEARDALRRGVHRDNERL